MAAADITNFNLLDNEKAQRKLLVTAVNVGDSITAASGTPEWQVVGVGVEDSNIEESPDVETITDILGITETTINKLETSQSLEPMTIRGGSKLAVKLYNQLKYNRLSEFARYEVMELKYTRTAHLHLSQSVVAHMLICLSTLTTPMTRFMEQLMRTQRTQQSHSHLIPDVNNLAGGIYG